MTLTLDAPPPLTDAVTRLTNLHLAPAGPSLWRAVDRSGLVVGHVQAVPAGRDVRFRARRFHAATRAFRDLGEFWSADDALECVAFAR